MGMKLRHSYVLSLMQYFMHLNKHAQDCWINNSHFLTAESRNNHPSYWRRFDHLQVYRFDLKGVIEVHRHQQAASSVFEPALE